MTTNQRPRSYQIRAAIRDIDPSIWRRLEVPAEFSLEELHRVLQISFGWTSSHLFGFRIGRRRYEMSDEEIDDEAVSPRSPLLLTKLRDVLRRGTSATYEYDPGDDWILDIVVEQENLSSRTLSHRLDLTLFRDATGSVSQSA